MLIKTKKGMYQIQKDYRDAFSEEAFVDKYIEECMDKYMYVVGDISSGILRLKGFDTDPKSKSYYGFIEDYLQTSCAFGCPYYVLKRIKNDQEYEKLLNDKTEYSYGEVSITPIKKENFDKESLVLKSTPKGEPNIVIDMAKVNSIPKGELASDLVEFVKQDKVNLQNTKVQKQAKAEEAQTTYVSASPDFDPSKSNSGRFNRNNNSKNKNHNKNRHQNKNK